MFLSIRPVRTAGRRTAVYFALVIAVSGLVATSTVALFRQGVTGVTALLAANQAPSEQARPPATLRGEVTLSQDDWTERIRSKEFWNDRGSRGGSGPYSARNNLQGPLDLPPVTRASLTRSEAARFHDGDDTTYRTVCVRLCDGYFFPISFSTTESNFKRDRQACESSCGSPAKLYIYKNPGEEPTDMKDLDGQPYSRLKTANLYRTKFEPQCKCKADPWEQTAMDRHRLYALEAQSLKGDKAAAKEASALKAQMATTAAEQRVGNGRKVGTLNAFTTSIVAADTASENNETTTKEVKAEPAAPTVSKTSKPNKSGNRNSRPPDIMRLGGGSPNGGSRATPSSASRSPERWRTNAFQGH